MEQGPSVEAAACAIRETGFYVIAVESRSILCFERTMGVPSLAMSSLCVFLSQPRSPYLVVSICTTAAGL